MWSNPKFKVAYKGNYFVVNAAKKERVFVLTGVKKDGSIHTISFESHQAAKKAGWIKS